MRIRLEQQDLDDAEELARRTHKRWKNRTGHYENKLTTHFVGKLGEISLEKALADHEIQVVETPFRDPDRQDECDLIIGKPGSDPIEAEVKTWRNEYWPDLGRCVAVGQVDQLQEKADAIIWTVVDRDVNLDNDLSNVAELGSLPVRIAGWSTIQDVEEAPVRMTGYSHMRKVENHQLDENDLRPLGTLLGQGN